MPAKARKNGKQNELPTDADRPISEIGKVLREQRAKAMANGGIKTMTVDEINDMIADIRSWGRRDPER